MKRILVTGAGGFIGWHLANKLVGEGSKVYAVDEHMPLFKPCKAPYFHILDLRYTGHVQRYFADCGPFDEVYALAADMGGIGYIEEHRADIMRNNVMINCNCLDAAMKSKVGRYLFTSSACVYPTYEQTIVSSLFSKKFGMISAWQLTESQAYPAQPEEGYGWEKLYTEMMCKYYKQELGLETRVVRLHNIYGPYGTYDGGREKAPAALCRKVAKANGQQALEIWGDGNQIRTFCYIDDCVEGLIKIMRSDYSDPVNLGSDKPITIYDLATLIMEIAGKDLGRYFVHNAATGVHARSSDNTLLKEITGGWEPQIDYKEGLAKTYKWIESEIKKKGALK